MHFWDTNSFSPVFSSFLARSKRSSRADRPRRLVSVTTTRDWSDLSVVDLTSRKQSPKSYLEWKAANRESSHSHRRCGEYSWLSAAYRRRRWLANPLCCAGAIARSWYHSLLRCHRELAVAVRKAVKSPLSIAMSTCPRRRSAGSQ